MTLYQLHKRLAFLLEKNPNMKRAPVVVSKTPAPTRVGEGNQRGHAAERKRMIIETKYNLGDQLWVIVSDYAHMQVECFACQKTGKIKLGEEEFTCPKCHGAAKAPTCVGRKWFISTVGIVGKVDADVVSETYVTSRDYDKAKQVRYMLDSTGVGSGTSWPEEDLWPSREAAEAECTARNFGKKWEDD